MILLQLYFNPNSNNTKDSLKTNFVNNCMENSESYSPKDKVVLLAIIARSYKRTHVEV